MLQGKHPNVTIFQEGISLIRVLWEYLGNSETQGRKWTDKSNIANQMLMKCKFPNFYSLIPVSLFQFYLFLVWGRLSTMFIITMMCVERFLAITRPFMHREIVTAGLVLWYSFSSGQLFITIAAEYIAISRFISVNK